MSHIQIPVILQNIQSALCCRKEDITELERLGKGLNNESFTFCVCGKKYVYRHPGRGTEATVNRHNEKKSLMIASELGFDPTYIYADENEGWKISRYVADFREPDYSSREDSVRILAELRRLHSSGVKVEYGLAPWEDSLVLESDIKKKAKELFLPFEGLKEKIHAIYKGTLGDGVEKCFCHGDSYAPNWMLCADGRIFLIDWEYAGFADPGIDIGYYIADAMFDFPEAENFIKEYLRQDYNAVTLRHYLSYVAIVAYYWSVWALYIEVTEGRDLSQEKENWLFMAEKYAEYVYDRFCMNGK